MLQFGLRLGRHPRCLVATTPRPTKLIRELLAREGRDVVVTRGSTYENRANLAPGFFDQIIRKYEGTRLGRQELNAELLEDTPGALWSQAMIDAARLAAAPHLARIVVAIDPAVTSGEDADETGIIVVGKDHQGHGYVLADASGKHQPIEWAKIAVAAYRAHHADRIVAERNNGGAMVEATIRMVDGNVPVTTVWASRGKTARAEPVSALYEQGRVHHIGTFSKLEDQMCAFTSDFDRARAGPGLLPALDQRPRPEILAVEVEKIEQKEDQRRCVAAVRSELDDVEGRGAVGAHAAQFAVEIGLARVERRHGLGDRRIFVGPVEPGARQQLHRAAVEPRMHAVAVVFDFMQPLVAVRRRVDELRSVAAGSSAGKAEQHLRRARYGARHDGSGQGLLCRSMGLF